jgi:hypothetical protein
LRTDKKTQTTKENIMDKTSIYKSLREALPDGAIKPHPTKKFLSTINPAYVLDHLNTVLGIGGWAIEYEIISATEKMVIAKGVLTIPELGVKVEQFGGNDNPDRGDAYKGACTDALTKCASYIGVGLGVWMNEKLDAQQQQQKKESATTNLITEIQKLQNSRLLDEKQNTWIEKELRSGMTKERSEKVIEKLKALPVKLIAGEPKHPHDGE